MAEELTVAQERLIAAEAALKTGEIAVEEKRLEVVDTIVEATQGVDPRLETLTSVLNSDGVSDLIRLEEARTVIVGNETREYDELAAAQVLLRVQQSEVEAARDETAAKHEAAADALEELQAVRDRALRAQAAVRDQVSREQVASRRARAARARDARLLRQLRSEEQRIEKRMRLAAQRALRPSAGGSPGHADAGFLRPTSGYISSPYGYRTHPIYGYYSLHDGVDIAAPCGTAVYAPLQGRVLSRYYSEVYGNRLFLGLGLIDGRYVTAVFNHLERSTVGRGAAVRRGQAVGAVGDTGWSTGCHLHFTVLVAGRAVDPETFF